MINCLFIFKHIYADYYTSNKLIEVDKDWIK